MNCYNCKGKNLKKIIKIGKQPISSIFPSKVINKLRKYKKLLVIIQARTSSIRFRNKVLQPIYGVPLILHVVNRVKKSNIS